MIAPKCDVTWCGDELDDYGAILLSPPKNGAVVKLHLCKHCYDRIADEFFVNRPDHNTIGEIERT